MDHTVNVCILCFPDLKAMTKYRLLTNQKVFKFSKLSISYNLMISKKISPLLQFSLSLFLSLPLHVELIDGTPTLKINHGSGTVVLQLPGNVNVADRRWHRLDVHSNSKVGRLTHLTPTTFYTQANK